MQAVDATSAPFYGAAMRLSWGSVALLLVACSSAGVVATAPAAPEAASDNGDVTTTPTTKRDAGKDAATAHPTSASNLRIMTGNVSSGNDSTYDHQESKDLLLGLHPDVALLQEMKVGDDTTAAFDAFVTETFGADFSGYREEGFAIPNAIVSRYPIADHGEWTDDRVSDRSFVWAKISAPNDHTLWAVSVHLLTTSSANRALEATAIVAHLKEVVGPDDFVVLGGDFNSDTRTEECVTTFSEIFTTTAPWPVDQKGQDRTSANRNHPYDWVVTDPKLAALQVPTVLGTSTYAAGLVLDSRVYSPLDDVTPIAATDSAFTNMQHMPVVKDFSL